MSWSGLKKGRMEECMGNTGMVSVVLGFTQHGSPQVSIVIIIIIIIIIELAEHATYYYYYYYYYY